MSLWLTRMSACALVSFAGIISMPADTQAAQSPTPMRLEELPPRVRAYASRVLALHSQIDGAVTPEQLSLSDLLRGRLSSLSTAIGEQLSHEDEKAIAWFAHDEAVILGQIRDAAKKRAERFCATRDGSATGLVAHWNRLREQEESELTAFYQSALDTLSVEGREAVQRHLNEQIAPRTRKSVVNLDAMAATMPDQVVAQFGRYCTATAERPATSIELQDQPRSGDGVLTPYGQ